MKLHDSQLPFWAHYQWKKTLVVLLTNLFTLFKLNVLQQLWQPPACPDLGAKWRKDQQVEKHFSIL